MLFASLRVYFILSFFLLSSFNAHADVDPRSYPTLSSVLVRSGIPATGWKAELLEQRVCSDDTTDDLQYIAYGAFRQSDPTKIDLHIGVCKGAAWEDRVIPNSGPLFELVNSGSINSIDVTPSGVYISTHINPSLSTTLVLNRYFRAVGTFYGWPLGFFENGEVLFEQGQVHFAAVHPLELGIYNPRTHKSRIVYPLATPGPVRKTFGELLETAFAKVPKQWFMEHNYPADPARFTEYLRAAEVVPDVKDGSAIFWAKYEGCQLDLLSERYDCPELDVEVIGVFRRLARPSDTVYREFRAEEIRRLIPFTRIEELATRAVVDRLFALPYP